MLITSQEIWGTMSKYGCDFSDEKMRNLADWVASQLARANEERQKFIGLFSDYEFSCKDFETAAKIWAQMRALQVKTKDELDLANETADAKVAAAIADVVEFVKGCEMIGPSPIGPLHGVGWNEAVRLVANRVEARAKSADASRALAEQIRKAKLDMLNDAQEIVNQELGMWGGQERQVLDGRLDEIVRRFSELTRTP